MNNQKNDNEIFVDMTHYSVFHGFRKIFGEMHVALALIDMHKKVLPDLLMIGLKMMKI